MVRASGLLATTLAGAVVATMLTTGACTQAGLARFAERGMLSRWEKKFVKPETGRSRALADQPAPKCLKDRLNAADLGDDVARLEKSLGGEPMQGGWHGIDLSQIPRPQAEFLQNNETWIAPPGVSFAGCKDAPCVIDRVYGDPTGQEGLKAYWWYLRMHTTLSLVAKVPGISTAGATYKDFLFSDNELSGFWKVSWMLSPRYRTLHRALQTIHRLPHDQYLDAYQGSPMGENVCGIEYGSTRSGIIILMDRCLDMDVPADNPANLSGEFLIGVSHEISHALDHDLSTDDTRFTETKQWASLSGWTEEQVADPTTGGLAEKWNYDPSKDGFVDDYAHTSPYEDWAETAAFFRYKADETRTSSPKKFEFISKKIYDGRTFDSQGLAAAYEKQVNDLIAPQLLDLVQACVTSPPASAAPSSRPYHLVLDAVPENIMSCLEQSLDDKISGALDQVRATEFEACGYLKDNDTILRGKIFDDQNPAIASMIAEQLRLAPALRAVHELREQLEQQLDAREAYRHCYSDKMPEDCYKNAMSAAFDRVAQPYAKDLGDQLESERGIFLAAHPFADTGVLVSQFYRMIFAGMDPALVAAADATWDRCSAAGAAQAPPSPGPSGSPSPSSSTEAAPDVPVTVPFSGGTQFVSTPILNCVNAAALEDLRVVRDRVASRMGIGSFDSDAATYIRDVLMLPRYLEVMNAHLAQAAGEEQKERDARKAAVIDVLVSRLQADSSWYAGAATNAEAITACLPVAESGFSSYFSHVDSSDVLPTRFAAIEDIRLRWSKEACAKAAALPSVTDAIRAHAQSLWEQSMQELDTMVATEAQAPGASCRSANPGRWHSYSRARCLRRAWDEIVNRALADWDQSDGGKRFATRRADAQSYLEANRRQLQEKAISAMESGR